MDQKTDNNIKRFLQSIEGINIRLNSAFLFGSFAKGNERVDSDIDIALVLEDLMDHEKFDLQVKLLLLASHIDSRIEPHPFSQQDFQIGTPFTAEIKNTGIKLPLI